MKKFAAWLLRGVGSAALLVWFACAIVVVLVALITLIIVCIPLVLAQLLTSTAQGDPLNEAFEKARAKIIAFPAIEP